MENSCPTNTELKESIFSIISLGLAKLQNDGKILLRYRRTSDNFPTYQVMNMNEIKSINRDFFYHEYIFPNDIKLVMSNPSAGAELMFYLLGLALDRE